MKTIALASLIGAISLPAAAGCVAPVSDGGKESTAETTPQALTGGFGPALDLGQTSHTAIAAGAYLNEVWAFYTDVNNEDVYVSTFNTSSKKLNTPTFLAFQTDQPLATATCFDGIYVFAKGLNQSVYYEWHGATGGWSGWQEVPGAGTTNAALSAQCPGSGTNGLRVYMKGIDNHIYENVRSEIAGGGTTWQGWSGWHQIQGAWTTNVALGTAVTTNGDSAANTNVALFLTGTNDVAYTVSWTPNGPYTSDGAWGAWSNLNGTSNVPIAGAQDFVMMKGMNDEGYYQSFNDATVSWPDSFSLIGPGTTATPYGIAYLYTGQYAGPWNGYYVFAKGGNDNAIYLSSTAPALQ